MTLQEFKKKVLRASRYEKYLYYGLYSSLILGVLYFLVKGPDKQVLNYEKIVAMYAAFLFLMLGAGFALWLIPNRYKVLSLPSNLSIVGKNEIMYELVKKLNSKDLDRNDSFYKFSYYENPKSYSVYAGISVDTFYLSIQGKTSTGIIDLGGTEQVRSTILHTLEDIVLKNISITKT